MFAMIEINMLPMERRQKEQTPLPVYLSLVGGVALLSTFLFLWLYQGIRVGQLREEQERVRARLTEINQNFAAAEDLEHQIQENQNRLETILDIHEGKIFWYQKLGWLAGLMPAQVWLESLQFSESSRATGPRTAAGPQLTMECASEGSLDTVNEFVAGMRESTNFIYHFGPPGSRGGITTTEDRDVPGRFILNFDLVLPLRPNEFQAAREAQQQPAPAGRPAGRPAAPQRPAGR